MAPGGAIAVDGAVAVEVAVDVDVPVAVEVVVMLHVDVDLVVVPVAVAPERADDGDTCAKCQAGRQCSGYRVFGRRRVVDRWARRVGPGAVDLRRVVAGDVDHLRIGRLDDDGLRRRRLLHNRGTTAGRGLSGSRRRRFNGDGLLLIRLQVAGGLGLATQALDGVHHRIRLGQEGIADPLYPDRVLSQRRQYQREGNQRLDAGVPWLICHLLYGVVATDFGVRLRPCCRVGHIARIGGRHQHLRQQRVGIQREGREHLVQLLRGEYGLGLLLCRGRGRGQGRWLVARAQQPGPGAALARRWAECWLVGSGWPPWLWVVYPNRNPTAPAKRPEPGTDILAWRSPVPLQWNARPMT